MSSSECHLVDISTEETPTLDMVQNTNEHFIPDSLPVPLQHSDNNKHSAEAVTQSLQYGNLNVTDSRPVPHPHDDYNLVYSDNKGPDVSADHPTHNVDDISASALPHLTQLPTECLVSSQNLGSFKASFPLSISQQPQQTVPPMTAYHSSITTDAIRWSNSQPQHLTNMETVSNTIQQFSYQGNGRGNPSRESMIPHQYHGDLHNPYHHVNQTPSPNSQHINPQYHEASPYILQPGEMIGKKVFILHYISDSDGFIQTVEALATYLREIGVDISIDLFEKDPGNVKNWSIWYEDEISSSDVVLCIITPNFNYEIRKTSIYNLLSDQKGIAFRAVFLDSPVVKEYIPLSMRGAMSYCISSQNLSVGHDSFASLYAFLTGQNRLEKPPVGKVVRLTPKRNKCKYTSCI